VGLDELFEVDAADFFFAFDEGDDVDGDAAPMLPVGEEGLKVAPDLSFVIDSAAGEDGVEAVFIFADGGFERGRGPLVEGLGGLDIVVAVNQDGGAVGLVLVFGEDDGVSGGRDDLWGEAAGGKLVGDELGAALHVGDVLRLGADAGDAEEGLEAVEGLLAVDVDVLEDFVEHGQ